MASHEWLSATGSRERISSSPAVRRTWPRFASLRGGAFPESGPNPARAAPRWKRCLDVCLIAIVAPALIPVMLAMALLIKLMSRGPVLFRQPRIGLGGAVFECFKFRTMHVNAPTGVHELHFAQLIHSNRPMSKLDGHDPRIFPFARLWRAVGLDELPQLFNVLRGEMSLVGPRPSTPREFQAFSAAERDRTKGLPGLTGLWQVSGKNDTTFTEMIQLDLRYLRTQCLWLDLGILMRTPLVLLSEADRAIRVRKAAGPSMHGVATRSEGDRPSPPRCASRKRRARLRRPRASITSSGPNPRI